VLFVLKAKLAKYKNEAFGRMPPVFMANVFANLQVVDAFLAGSVSQYTNGFFCDYHVTHTHTRVEE